MTVIDRLPEIISGGDRMTVLDIDEIALEEILNRGYELRNKLGEGSNRTAFRVVRKRGHVEEELVAKIPKPFPDVSSVQKALSAEKAKGKNLNLHEAKHSTKMWHPNVARTVDSFDLADGRTINVESFYEGSRSIRNEIAIHKNGFPFPVYTAIMNGLIKGLKHLHAHGLLHRDLGPENTLVTNQGEGVITDLQTIVQKNSIIPSTEPTRGNINYTDPVLINALLNRRSESATEKSDIYSLGAIAYFMLTGEDPHAYRLEESRSGTPVRIGDMYQTICLREGERNLESITKEKQEKDLRRLAQKMREKGVPKRHREFILKCMRTSADRYVSHKTLFTDMTHVNEEFEKIKSDLSTRLRDTIVEKLPWSIGLGLTLGIPTILASLGLAYGMYAYRDAGVRVVPAFDSILQRDDDTKITVAERPLHQKGLIYEILAPRIDKAQEILPLAKEYEAYVSSKSYFAHTVHFMNPRLVAAWLRACKVNQIEAQRGYRSNNVERDRRLFAPKYIATPEQISMFGGEDEEIPIGCSVMHLKKMIVPDRSLEEIFIHYFSTEEEIRRAIAQTRESTYFPQVAADGTILGEGYRTAIPEYQRALIETAVALYEISDESTKVYWGALQGTRDRVRKEQNAQ